MRKLITTLLLTALMTASVWAQGLEEDLHFKPGTSSTQIKRGIARGETMRFHLGANGGQKMTVVVQSVEKNAVFEVWGDGGQIGQSQEMNGKQKWTGVLPGYGAGNYAIDVGSERGGAEFNLYVEIK